MNNYLYKYADTTAPKAPTPPVVVPTKPTWGDWTRDKAYDTGKFIIDNPGKSLLIGGTIAGGLWLADSYARASAERRRAERELYRGIPKDVVVEEPKPVKQPKQKKASYMYRYNPYNDFYYYSNLYKQANINNNYDLYNQYYRLYKQAGIGSLVTKGLAWGAKNLRQAPAAFKAWGAQAGNNLRRTYTIGAQGGGGWTGGMKAVGGQMWNGAGRMVKNMGQGIKNQWNNAGQYIQNNGGVGGVAKNMWNGTVQGVKDMGKGINDRFWNVAGTYRDGAFNAGLAGKNTFVGGMKGMWNAAKTNMGKGWNSMKQQVGNAWNTGAQNAKVYNDASSALLEKGVDPTFARNYANHVLGGIKAGAYIPHRKYTVYSFLNK